MDKASFSMHFHGPAVDNNSIDVAHLAPALLTMGDLIKAAGLELHGTDSHVSVRIQAFAPGSFGIDLAVVQEGARSLTRLFSSQQASATANLIALLGFAAGTGKGLVAFIQWLRDRKIRLTEDVPGDRTAVAFTLDNGDRRVVPRDTVALYRNSDVRGRLETVLADSLDKDGIESIGFGADRAETTLVKKDEARYFRLPEMNNQLTAYEIKKWLQPVNISFKENNKWRLTDNEQTFYATISDKDFMERVAAGLPISGADLFFVQLRVLQQDTQKGLQTTYEVLRVLEHRPAGQQMTLPTE